MIINGSKLLEAAPIKNMEKSKLKAHGLSYGLSEVGYDIRMKQKVVFKAPSPYGLMELMKKLWSHGMDYKLNQEEQEILDGSVTVYKEDGTVQTYLGRTAIASSIEEFCIPRYLWAEFRNKSTNARRFIDAALGTDGEPGWDGFLTIELIFNGMEDITLEPGYPILKAVFHEIKEEAEYKGKYQDQPDDPVPPIFL